MQKFINESVDVIYPTRINERALLELFLFHERLSIIVNDEKWTNESIGEIPEKQSWWTKLWNPSSRFVFHHTREKLLKKIERLPVTVPLTRGCMLEMYCIIGSSVLLKETEFETFFKCKVDERAEPDEDGCWLYVGNQSLLTYIFEHRNVPELALIAAAYVYRRCQIRTFYFQLDIVTLELRQLSGGLELKIENGQLVLYTNVPENYVEGRTLSPIHWNVTIDPKWNDGNRVHLFTWLTNHIRSYKGGLECL